MTSMPRAGTDLELSFDQRQEPEPASRCPLPEADRLRRIEGAGGATNDLTRRRSKVQMAERLAGKRIAILVENGFEQVELTSPKEALEQAGAKVDVVSPVDGKVKGWEHTDWGDELPVDVRLENANPADYDGLVLPGGVMNPDKLRVNEKALRFVRAFFESGKPVASICHGPWTLINAGVAKGRKLTSYHTIRKDLENAGARWVDEEVVVDHGLVTSRSPKDLKAFNAKTIEEFAEGVHQEQRKSA